MYPQVKNKPISENRKKDVINEIIKNVKLNSLGRYIVNVILPTNENNQKFALVYDKPFFKLGISLIMDKIWFVDYVEGSTSYSHHGIGYAEGMGIADGETKGIIGQILSECDIEENQIKANELKKTYIDEAISKLQSRSIRCNCILTNLTNIFKFWQMEGFKGFIKGEIATRGLEGSYKDIPVYWSNFLPKGVTFIFNKDILGDLFIKRDISANISEINENEKDNVIKSLPELKNQDLSEKIRLYADEIIRFELRSKDAIVILKTP